MGVDKYLSFYDNIVTTFVVMTHITLEVGVYEDASMLLSMASKYRHGLRKSSLKIKRN